MFGKSRKCIALPAAGRQAWKIMEEMTFELILIGECEIELTDSTGRGTACAKPPRSRRLKGRELQLVGASGRPVRLARRWSWKGRQPPCGEEPDHMLGVGFIQQTQGATEDFK